MASVEDATGTGEMAGAAIAQETVVGFCEAEVDWEFLQRKELCHNLEPWFSKCGPLTSSIGVTWELVRSVNSWAHPRPI